MPASPVELIYGPLFVGFLMNILLYGIMITQTYLYLSTFKNDKKWMRAFVWLIFFADTLNTFFDSAFFYMKLIRHFGDVEVAMVADWVFNTDPALTGIIALMVQLFFAWRVKLLVNNIFVTILIVFCAVVSGLAGIGTGIACGMIPHFVDFHQFAPIVIIWLAFAALADIIIAGALVMHFRSQRTGFAATDTLINKLIRMTVQTGGITAVFAVADLTTYLTSPSTAVHLTFNFPLAKLYTNTLLSTLNARAITHGSGPLTPSSGARAPGNLSGRQVGMWKGDTYDVELGPAMSKARAPGHAADPLGSMHNAEEAGQTGTRVYVAVEEVKQVTDADDAEPSWAKGHAV